MKFSKFPHPQVESAQKCNFYIFFPINHFDHFELRRKIQLVFVWTKCVSTLQSRDFSLQRHKNVLINTETKPYLLPLNIIIKDVFYSLRRKMLTPLLYESRILKCHFYLKPTSPYFHDCHMTGACLEFPVGYYFLFLFNRLVQGWCSLLQ